MLDARDLGGAGEPAVLERGVEIAGPRRGTSRRQYGTSKTTRRVDAVGGEGPGREPVACVSVIVLIEWTSSNRFLTDARIVSTNCCVRKYCGVKLSAAGEGTRRSGAFGGAPGARRLRARRRQQVARRGLDPLDAEVGEDLVQHDDPGREHLAAVGLDEARAAPASVDGGEPGQDVRSIVAGDWRRSASR